MPPRSSDSNDDTARLRADMVAVIRAQARETAGETGRSSFSERVLAAMEAIPRHAFLPQGDERIGLAYADSALPIGCGQTISQPFIVALMTDLLDPSPQDVVLEVGTGSGYQAAVLSRLVKHVYSIEIVARLAERARRQLEALGCDNVTVEQRDGHRGWPEHAPYEGILVTAAATTVPESLIEQLRPGGRLVIPLGQRWSVQMLTAVEKLADGTCERRPVLPVSFVPFTGDAG